MSRLIWSLLLGGVLLAACDPGATGPPVPRPVVSAAEAITTTTVDPLATAAEAPTTTVEECLAPLCLVYHIDPRASWDDGEPVTAEDFAYTVEMFRTATAPGMGEGYTAIREVEIVGQKTLRLELSSRYGPWRSLFNRVFRSGDDVTTLVGLDTSGPFEFSEWEVGQHLTVDRDPRWWSEVDPLTGETTGDIARIRFVFIDSLEEMVDALEAGEIDVMVARPDAAATQRLREMEDVGMALSPGPFWEHIDFHHDDPVLSARWAREAISLAIDREEILDRTVRLIDPGVEPLDNTVWMSNTTHYEPHFQADHDPERAEEILVDNGCTLGGDGVYLCDGTRLSFVWASTNDDPDRSAIFDSVREDLAEVGIELVGDFRSPSAFVTRDFLFGGPDVWQMINFSWRAWPDPAASNATYYCSDSGLNVNRYCSEQVEDLVASTGSIVDGEERAAVFNRADRLYLEDHAVIPLYQKPDMIAWRGNVTGPSPNFGYSSELWNIASWTGPTTIVVALPTEPLAIDPLSSSDEMANLIMGTLLYGAYGMTPNHEYVPVLVDSVEVSEGRS